MGPDTGVVTHTMDVYGSKGIVDLGGFGGTMEEGIGERGVGTEVTGSGAGGRHGSQRRKDGSLRTQVYSG